MKVKYLLDLKMRYELYTGKRYLALWLSDTFSLFVYTP